MMRMQVERMGVMVVGIGKRRFTRMITIDVALDVLLGRLEGRR